ncbi:hypothetical protein LXA43DRAFT_887864 [Ganoderma leucocontextum]|nr:hypothetical protein LXA43DRAFT_887864 [Ganoderma leucocontextum]
MSARLTRKRARTDPEEDPQDAKPDESSLNPGTLADSEANVSDPAEEATQLKKDPEFWFDDGTVILHAGDVEFRVYRGLLESHSTVFTELFAQSQSKRTVSFDGQHNIPCPVVNLSDSAHDLRHVLRCCMPRHSGSPFTTATPSFDLVSAAIRLGHKYKINDMYQKGLTLLKGHYSHKFEIWDSVPSWSPSGWEDAQAIGVINLARLTGELSLLPVAFMVCIVRLDENLVRGFTREDGSQEHLTLDDIGLCFQARIRLREASVAALFRVLSTTSAAPNCRAPPQCSKMMKNAFRGKRLEANVKHLITGDVLLWTTLYYFKDEDDEFTLCQACLDAVHERDRKENRALGCEARHDDEFWFEDGTIILHAGDVEIRVYRGLLEDHSPVFKELFSQSHPTRTLSIDGQQFSCPVVRVTDSVQDLRHVLRGCMPKHTGSLFATTVVPSFDIVSAAIRLGQKYKIIDMYQEGLSFLKGHYTDSLDTWNEIDTWSPTGWDDLQAIGVINLARSTGELSLLPTAFMVCAVLLQSNLVHGFTREDGSQEHLTLDDIGRCLEAKDRLREASVIAHFRALTPAVAPACKASSQCARTFKHAFRGKGMEANVHLMMTDDVLLNTPLRYFETKDGNYTLCQPCVAMVDERDRKENLALWNRLPGLLGIDVPAWGESAAAPAPAPPVAA